MTTPNAKGLHDPSLTDILDAVVADLSQTPDVSLTVTHQSLEDTSVVDEVEVGLRQMLHERLMDQSQVPQDLPPMSTSADLSGYPGLFSQD